MRTRLLVAAALIAAGCAVPAAHAQPGCPPGGEPTPAGAAQRDAGDLDGDGRPDTLWLADTRDASAATRRFVGVTTASGASSQLPLLTASPIPLRALAIDAQDSGQHQIIVSTGRGAQLYVFQGCAIQTVVDAPGTPFVFDLQNLRGTGTGVGCSDLGDGRRLVALQALDDGGRWTVHRTAIELDGTLARVGRSDTVTASSAQDPAVTSAHTISCGDVDIDQDGVQEP